MKLYYFPGACSLAPHIVLRELAIDHALVKVDLASKETEAGEPFVSVNPKGYVPALILDNHALLTETPAILQYLADLRPDAALAPPPGTFVRVVLQEWLNFVTAELHKPMGTLFDPALPAGFRDTVLQKLRPKLAYLSAHLASLDYLMADGFSVADAYAFAILNWSTMLDIDLSAWPALVAYKRRVASRPRVREALTREGLDSDV